MPVREGDGKVRCEHGLPAELGRGGAGVGVLDAGWGLEAVEGEKKGEERIYPRSHLGSPSFFVSKCKRTSAKGWVLKRGQRERERWSARGSI
jgi:hypothetical protein